MLVLSLNINHILDRFDKEKMIKRLFQYKKCNYKASYEIIISK